MTTSTAYQISESEARELETTAIYQPTPIEGLVKDANGTYHFDTLGHIGTLAYKNPLQTGKGGVSDRVFQPINDGKVYPMTATRDQQILAPRAVIEPLVDQGWTIQNHQTMRGGICFVTTLAHPEITIPDFIGWDGLNKSKEGVLRPSIVVKGNLQNSGTIEVIAGFFRLVCINGLVAKVLGMGHLNLNFRTFKVADVRQLADRQSLTTDIVPMKTYQTSTFGHVAGLLTNLHSGDETIDHLPQLLRRPVTTLLQDFGARSQQSLTHQFEMMSEAEIPTISVMDILNALTNASRNIRIQSNLDNLTTAVDELSELYQWMNR